MALPGRKSLRQFQCNDTLWVTFRRMAEGQEKEGDDMIADAMEAYAQLSGYQTGINALESESQLTPPPSSAHHRQRPAPAAAPPPPPHRPSPPAPAPACAAAAAPPAAAASPASPLAVRSADAAAGRRVDVR